MPVYPLSPRLVVSLVRDVLLQRPRSFRADARCLVARLSPPLRVLRAEHLPASGPCLLTVNHFARPGFRAWWIPLAISAQLSAEVHWISTIAWTFPNRPLAREVLMPASRWVLRRVANVYGFTAMPPMPPDPADVEARAQAVRHVLSVVRQSPHPIIGLAPEGRDAPDGSLLWPPSGAGRFILQLAKAGLPIIPIGAFEEEAFCIRFGPAYHLPQFNGLPPDDRDREARRAVMRAIALLLPAPLRGEFRDNDGS